MANTISRAAAITNFPCRGHRRRNYVSSVNCSNSVRWIIEKLSSETMVSTVSPSGLTWASMPSMLSTSLPRSASKIAGPSTTAPGAVADGPSIFEADFGQEIDNMEGIDAHVTADGDTMLTMVSDDNFSPLQRTLLLQFRLVE